MRTKGPGSRPWRPAVALPRAGVAYAGGDVLCAETAGRSSAARLLRSGPDGRRSKTKINGMVSTLIALPRPSLLSAVGEGDAVDVEHDRLVTEGGRLWGERDQRVEDAHHVHQRDQASRSPSRHGRWE